MKLPIMRVISQNVSLLNTGMQVVELISETCVPFSGINVCSNVAGGLPRDMYFGVVAKDVDIVVYGRADWAMLNDHDEFFETLEDNLHYMFDGDVVNMTDDTSESASSQPDNNRVYRVYACGMGLVNIIFYQGCYSLEDVIAKFDNTINAFWVDQVGAAFNGLHYEGKEVTAIVNPTRVTTPGRDQRMREKAAMFGLHYQDPNEIPVRSTGMSSALAATLWCASRLGDPPTSGISLLSLRMHNITKTTKVTMPVCPSDWATNEFAPFGNEAKLRGRNIQEYVQKHFHRGCTFFKRDGELYVTFNANRIAHREIAFMKRAFFIDNREHTFKDVGV